MFLAAFLASFFCRFCLMPEMHSGKLLVKFMQSFLLWSINELVKGAAMLATLKRHVYFLRFAMRFEQV